MTIMIIRCFLQLQQKHEPAQSEAETSFQRKINKHSKLKRPALDSGETPILPAKQGPARQSKPPAATPPVIQHPCD